jgi:hypothetical protein
MTYDIYRWNSEGTELSVAGLTADDDRMPFAFAEQLAEGFRTGALTVILNRWYYAVAA